MNQEERNPHLGISDLAHLPDIEGLPMAKKAAIRISVNSCYVDNTWDLCEFAYEGVAYYIKFAIMDDTGACLTEPRFVPLLESVKDFAYTMLKRATGGHARPSIGTVVGTINKSLVFVVRWMMQNGFTQFADLSSTDIERVLSYIKSAPLANDPKAKAKVTTIAQRAFSLRYLYENRRYLRDGFGFDPFPGTTINKWAGVTAAIKKAGKTKRIPDDIAIDLVQKAVDYIRDVNPEKDAVLLRAACFIVIAMLSGMRISEILSIQHSDDPKKDCIREEYLDIEGVRTKVVWLHGRLYKTARDRKGKPARWMVPPVVVEAVNALRELSAPMRARLGSQHLFAPLKVNENVRTRPTVKAAKINDNLGLFMEALSVRFYQETEASEPEVWSLHAHQFRKTYARFMARNRFNLKMLQEHFGHVAYSMTLWYAFDDIDTELMEEIENEAALFPEELAESILSGKESVGGGGASEWAEHRDRYNRCKTAEDKEAYLKSLAATMVVHANGLGYCIYNPRRAMCSGGAGSGIVCTPDKCGNATVTLQYAPVYITTAENLRALLKSRHCKSAAQQAVVIEKLNRSITVLEGFTSEELQLMNNGMKVDLTRPAI